MKKPWCYLETKKGEKIKIDQEDLERVSNHSWRIQQVWKKSKKRVVTSIRTGEKVRSMSLGQFLMKPPKGKLVYPRRYQDGMDYRKSNLIVCTMKERQQMLPKHNSANSTSIYKGVSYIKDKKTWRARIEVKGKALFLGDYKSEAAAARAYNKAALEKIKDC